MKVIKGLERLPYEERILKTASIIDKMNGRGHKRVEFPQNDFSLLETKWISGFSF